MNIEEAIEFAVKAHRGQKDLEGKPEILHPLAVGLAGENETEIVTGLLHDVIEDSRYTLDDMDSLHLNREVKDALRLLTRGDEAYMDYVRSIAESGNELAIKVKRSDLLHNLKRGIRYGHGNLVKKHTKALAVIEDAYQRISRKS